MQHQFEARPTVEEIPTNYDGEVLTHCQAIRIRNRSTTDPIILNVSGSPFSIAPGASWGIEVGDVRSIILRPLRLQTGLATALVERIFLTQL